MCFFTSLSANAAAVAKKYGKQLDIIEAARQILAEQEQEERAGRKPAPNTRLVSTTFDWPRIYTSFPLTPSRNVSLFPGATNSK